MLLFLAHRDIVYCQFIVVHYTSAEIFTELSHSYQPI